MSSLFDSAFSPFARKVRMVLEHKGIAFEALDGLLKSYHAALKAVIGRIEVPVLVDGDATVVNSADIVSYLEFRLSGQSRIPCGPRCARARPRLGACGGCLCRRRPYQYLLLEVGVSALTAYTMDCSRPGAPT